MLYYFREKSIHEKRKMSKLTILKLIADNIHTVEAAAKIAAKSKPIIDNITSKIDAEIEEIVMSKKISDSWSSHIANVLTDKITSANNEQTSEKNVDDVYEIISEHIKNDTFIVGNENGKFFVKFNISPEDLDKFVK